MPLFLARHTHAPERCPAATPEAARLLAHVSAAAAADHGVAIQAETVLEDHTIYLVLEAATREQVERYMDYFARIGTVRVWAAISGEEAVARHGCASADAARGSPDPRHGQAGRGADAAGERAREQDTRR